ncbi:MAG: hypothetical protein A4E66_00315 [Syntrophus sp. PtaB.Bin001]|nr:MAG: hypothetical protein A4E66_00315 [Syntrophus sp. PtaB.Bin001]
MLQFFHRFLLDALRVCISADLSHLRQVLPYLLKNPDQPLLGHYQCVTVHYEEAIPSGHITGRITDVAKNDIVILYPEAFVGVCAAKSALVM